MGDERLIVVVGNIPPLEDIISGACTEKPFDLESFNAYARNNHFVENLDFLRKVRLPLCFLLGTAICRTRNVRFSLLNLYGVGGKT